MTVNVTCIRLTICRAGARSRQVEEYKGTSGRRVVEDSCDAQKNPAMLSSRVDADTYLFGFANVEHQESDRKPIPIRLRSCHPDAQKREQKPKLLVAQRVAREADQFARRLRS